jgi:hypothetical protein
MAHQKRTGWVRRVVHGQWSPRRRSGSAPLRPSKQNTAAAAGDLLEASFFPDSQQWASPK